VFELIILLDWIGFDFRAESSPTGNFKLELQELHVTGDTVRARNHRCDTASDDFSYQQAMGGSYICVKVAQYVPSRTTVVDLLIIPSGNACFLAPQQRSSLHQQFPEISSAKRAIDNLCCTLDRTSAESLGKGAARDLNSFRAVCHKLWRSFVQPIASLRQYR
jgi:hypothetical protein